MRIAIASDQSLVAEAVRAALAGRGFDAAVLRWPGVGTLARRQRLATYDAGLMLSELDRPDRVSAAMLLVQRVPTRWAVLTGAPHGSVWGAVLSAGARMVLPGSTRLDELVSVMTQMASGRGTSQLGRDELIAEWVQVRAQHEILEARFATLTPREREVLTLLHTGDSVAGISALLDTSPATVRSQVKAVLRKLQVNSQLAAVAAYGELLELRRGQPDEDDDAIVQLA
jgi:DNA-binding NarL/FixJ family response regulator